MPAHSWKQAIPTHTSAIKPLHEGAAHLSLLICLAAVRRDWEVGRGSAMLVYRRCVEFRKVNFAPESS
jgi:hypothetical protein